MASGSKNSKKTVTKPQVPQSVIDKWLQNNPSVEASGFTFSKLKELKLSASTNLNKSAKSQTDNKTFKQNIVNKLKTIPSGFTYNFSSTTNSDSSKSIFSGNTSFVKSTNNFSSLTKRTTPHRVKSTPISLTGGTKPAPNARMLSNSGLSLSNPATTFTAGTVDKSFPYGVGYGFNNAIHDIKIQSDGKILVAGETYGYYYYDTDTWDMQGLIRLNSDGTVDDTFSITYNYDCYGGGFNGVVNTIAIQPNGKILVGGGFNSFDRDGNCNNANYIIRLNSDGSRDLTFNSGNGFNGDVYSIEVQSNGKILVAGGFTSYNGTTSYYIIRLNSNGSIDSSFNIGTDSVSFDNYINKLLLQPDGKILCVGYFNNFSGVQQNYITRLNSNGTLDTTFHTGVGFDDEAITIALQSDGKIIVGGYFYHFDNNDLFGGRIVRLDTNGSLDTYFAYGLDSEVTSLCVQSNDKILVGGYMTQYYPDAFNIINIDELVRFNADCSFDYSFYYEELFNSAVNTIAIQSDGKVLVGGEFSNGIDPVTYPLNYFGRLNNSITTYPYVYLGWTDFCNGGTKSFITVGSMTPPVLSLYGPENVYSFSVISHPSQTKIGIAIPGTTLSGYPTNNIALIQETDYGYNGDGGCYNAVRDNAMVAVCYDVFDAVPEPYTILVDKKYKIGDIGFYNYLVDSSNNTYFHSTFQIIDLFEFTGSVDLPSEILAYIPYESAEESVKANGQYIRVYDCFNECDSWVLTKQYNTCISDTTISYTNCGNCGSVAYPLSYFDDYYTDNYGLISAGTPTINSTQVWGNCEDCAINSTPYGDMNYNFQNQEFNDDVYTMVVQPDNKILVGGRFTEYDNYKVNNITRLEANGDIDNTFNIGYSAGPVWSTETPFTGTGVGGSILFDGHSAVSANTDVGVWDLSDNDLTIEWFQYFTGDANTKPTVFTYSDSYLSVYFDGNYNIVLDINGTQLSFSSYNMVNDWNYFAITRTNTDTWSVYQNGNRLGQQTFYINFGQTSPLLIGDQSNYIKNNYTRTSFKGYITNFRVNNMCAIYTTETIDVPTDPLNPNYPSGGCNTILCLLVSNETDYINDSCDDVIQTTITSGNYLGEGFNNSVNTIALQSDGKILVGGEFTTYNGEFAGYIIRLNSDGSIDNSFTFGAEFNSFVYSIAIQNDGKIVVGGSFSYYYDYYCPGYIRLNSDGTPDTTFIQYPFEGEVYSVLLEDTNEIEFYSGVKSKKQNIIIGGWFDMNIPELDIQPNALVKFSSEGTFINTYYRGFTGYEYGVYEMKKQSDGKLICVGSFWEYNGDYCPYNIIRINTDGSQDFTFIKVISDDGGGFNNGYINSLEILPNGKIMVGGFATSFADYNEYYNNLPYLVRLNSDGSLDTTFTYDLDDNYVYKVLLNSNKTLLVGGEFYYYNAYRLVNLFIGEDFLLHSFNTCDGRTTNIYLPSTASTTNTTVNVSNFTLSLMNFVNDSYPVDDDYIICDLPAGYSIDFLNATFNSINVSSNSYITFGDPEINGSAGTCCFNIPDEISINGPGQPGVYISTACAANNLTDGLDNEAFFVYSGLSNDGNAMIIRYLGGYHCDYDYPNRIELVYNFVIYKGISNYFDLQIDNNTVFYNNDPTGGTSDGSNAFIGTFDSSSNKSYRVFSDGSVTSISSPIKADINTSNVVCGSIGDIISTPQTTVGTSKICGSMYFDGTSGTTVTVANNGAMDLDYDSWTIEWFQYFTSNESCCLRIFDIGSFSGEEVGASIENDTIAIWLASGGTFVNLISPVKDTWTHFAITSENIGFPNRIIRVFQNGVLLDSFSFSSDLNNFQGDPQVDLPLTIGGMGNGDATFEGYITNFRWTKGTCYYFENFNVPTSPLTTRDSQMLLLATNSADLLYDTTENQIITANNVTWSQLNPFGFPEYYISTDLTKYADCAACTATTMYNATLLVRDGVNTPYINRVSISADNINKIQTYGPLFSDTMNGMRGVEYYEILTYSL